MPGKVNPVVCEIATQVAAQVIGNDAAIAVGGLSGQLQLNAFLPLIARNLLASLDLLSRAAELLAGRCVEGLEADRERAAAHVERSFALATALAPVLGYDAAAGIVAEAAARGLSVREVCRERRVLPEAELARLLDPLRQTAPDA
jgi:fumarate hydratase class II